VPREADEDGAQRAVVVAVVVNDVGNRLANRLVVGRALGNGRRSDANDNGSTSGPLRVYRDPFENVETE